MPGLEPQFDKPRVLFLGSGILGWRLFQALAKEPNCTLAGVIPWSLGPGRSSDDRHELQLIADARKRGLLTWLGKGANHGEFPQLLERLSIDCVFVGAWGEILSKQCLHSSPVQFINCHPSRLPEHRGPNPYSSAIVHGETETAVTFHHIDEGIDTGAIVGQCALAIGPDETGSQLRARAATLAAEMVPDIVLALRTARTLAATPQPELGTGSYYPPPNRSLEPVRWYWPAQQIHDHVRGIQPWFQPRTQTTERFVNCQILIQRTCLRARTTSRQAKPGTVVGIDGEIPWVATGDDRTDLGLIDFRLKFSGITLGRRLSRSLAHKLLVPGVRFVFHEPRP